MNGIYFPSQIRVSTMHELIKRTHTTHTHTVKVKINVKEFTCNHPGMILMHRGVQTSRLVRGLSVLVLTVHRSRHRYCC